MHMMLYTYTHVQAWPQYLKTEFKHLLHLCLESQVCGVSNFQLLPLSPAYVQPKKRLSSFKPSAFTCLQSPIALLKYFLKAVPAEVSPAWAKKRSRTGTGQRTLAGGLAMAGQRPGAHHHDTTEIMFFGC